MFKTILVCVWYSHRYVMGTVFHIVSWVTKTSESPRLLFENSQTLQITNKGSWPRTYIAKYVYIYIYLSVRTGNSGDLELKCVDRGRMVGLAKTKGSTPWTVCHHLPLHGPIINLVGGWPTPLKNMSSSVRINIPNIWKVIKHVPNHQLVIYGTPFTSHGAYAECACRM